MNAITAYKIFNDDWTCRGFQYEVGKTYEHGGDLSLCESGFHACEVPLDCWSYYDTHTFARVTLQDVSDKRAEDSKVVGAKITIEASLSLPEWIKAQVETVLGLCSAAATGDWGHAAATGTWGYAAATGPNSIAASLGIKGIARGADGTWIALAAYDADYKLVLVKTAKVGEDGLTPDTDYRLNTDGEFVEVKGGA